MTLADEIREQPAVLAGLLERASDIERIAAALRDRDVDHVVIAARGTSDHAAIYAQYLFGVRLGLPVGLATPSVLSLYGVEPRLGRALVMGISQSGASPDIVGVVAAGRRQGVPTIALTNDPGSPLAEAAEHVIDIGAGPERAIAATKTYTGELLALAILVAAWASPAGALGGDRALADVPAGATAALATEPAVASIAQALAPRDACVVVGRGFEYATAREWALKLKELAQVVADPYSAADFRHGPVALVDAGFPVLALAPDGRAAADIEALLRRLRDELAADTVVISDRDDLLALAGRPIRLSTGLPEHLAPIANIIPGQLYAMHATRARGLDPDEPRHIAKVTRTS
jgi:glucosamine--fructose-6-phosphate aminotransferase (isomerizing)